MANGVNGISGAAILFLFTSCGTTNAPKPGHLGRVKPAVFSCAAIFGNETPESEGFSRAREIGKTVIPYEDLYFSKTDPTHNRYVSLLIAASEFTESRGANLFHLALPHARDIKYQQGLAVSQKYRFPVTCFLVDSEELQKYSKSRNNPRGIERFPNFAKASERFFADELGKLNRNRNEALNRSRQKSFQTAAAINNGLNAYSRASNNAGNSPIPRYPPPSSNPGSSGGSPGGESGLTLTETQSYDRPVPPPRKKNTVTKPSHITCSTCRGTGKLVKHPEGVWPYSPEHYAGPQASQHIIGCSTCGGSGRVINR